MKPNHLHRAQFALLLVAIVAGGAVRLAADEGASSPTAAEFEQYAGVIARAQVKLSNGHTEEASDLLAGVPERLRGWEWGRLVYLCNLDLRTFSLLPGETVLASAGAGRWLLVKRADGSVSLWDAFATERVSTFTSPVADGNTYDLSPDGRTVLVVATDGTVSVVQTSDGHALWRQMFVTNAYAQPVTGRFSIDGKRLEVQGVRRTNVTATTGAIAEVTGSRLDIRHLRVDYLVGVM